MTNFLLLILIIIFGIAVSIEGIPKGLDQKAKDLLTALTVLSKRIVSQIHDMIMAMMTYINDLRRRPPPVRNQVAEQERPTSSVRVVTGAIVATVLSPIAAIPTTLLFTVVLFAIRTIGGNDYDVATNWHDTLKDILGTAFVVLVAALDVAFRWFLVSAPIFIGLAYIAAKSAMNSNRYWQRLVFSTFLIGALYPLIFMLATALDMFDGPFFN